jgi:hypothetical protein
MLPPFRRHSGKTSAAGGSGGAIALFLGVECGDAHFQFGTGHGFVDKGVRDIRALALVGGVGGFDDVGGAGLAIGHVLTYQRCGHARYAVHLVFLILPRASLADRHATLLAGFGGGMRGGGVKPLC